jgi:hypothetical protein
VKKVLLFSVFKSRCSSPCWLKGNSPKSTTTHLITEVSKYCFFRKLVNLAKCNLPHDDSELMIFDLLHIKVGTDNCQQTSFEVFLLITAGLILSINFELGR